METRLYRLPTLQNYSRDVPGSCLLFVQHFLGPLDDPTGQKDPSTLLLKN